MGGVVGGLVHLGGIGVGEGLWEWECLRLGGWGERGFEEEAGLDFGERQFGFYDNTGRNYHYH